MSGKIFYESPRIDHLTFVMPNGHEDVITAQRGVFADSDGKPHDPLSVPNGGLYIVNYGLSGFSLSVRRKNRVLRAVASQVSVGGKVHRQLWQGEYSDEIAEALISVDFPTLPIWSRVPCDDHGLLRGYRVDAPGYLGSAYRALQDHGDFEGGVYDDENVHRHIKDLEKSHAKEVADLRKQNAMLMEFSAMQRKAKSA